LRNDPKQAFGRSYSLPAMTCLTRWKFFKRLGYNTMHGMIIRGHIMSATCRIRIWLYLPGIGNGLDLEPLWPKSDNEMIEKTTPEFLDKEPFHVYYLTVSGHMPYSQFGNAMSERHWNVYPGYF